MIQWENNMHALPIKSWCVETEEKMVEQAVNLANHPVMRKQVCLMPDAHVGYGMPIGGVIACENALIPSAVGVDIGCGMGAMKTSLPAETFTDKQGLRDLMTAVKARIPAGEGRARSQGLDWTGFDQWYAALDEVPPWWSDKSHKLDRCNLGTLGGGNHFIEIQKSEEGEVWLMLHSGSRNMGQRIASYYHKEAKKLNDEMGVALPDLHLAFLPADSKAGIGYIRDMEHALSYALENRRIMMEELKRIMGEFFPGIAFPQEINIHHNYAALEEHEGVSYWIHRKGATSARSGELGIIPGSMGTSSYIVEGLGNPQSFRSCSHGAGRRLGRSAANQTLTLAECDAAMGDVVYDRFGFSRNRGADGKKLHDLSEAPLAYKDIDAVIEAERDLVRPLVRLRPLAVVKG